MRIYGKDYLERLKTAGFKVEVVENPNEIRPEEIVRYGLIGGVRGWLVK